MWVDRLYLLFNLTHLPSPSPPPPPSVPFKPGESVHLTSSEPGNWSTFFHPLTVVTMTLLLITGNGAAGWWVSQHARGVRPTGQAVNDERQGRRWKKRKERGGEEKKKDRRNSLHLRARRLDSTSVARKWSTRMDDFNTIFSNSIQFFLCPFSKEQRWRKTVCGEWSLWDHLCSTVI